MRIYNSHATLVDRGVEGATTIDEDICSKISARLFVYACTVASTTAPHEHKEEVSTIEIFVHFLQVTSGGLSHSES